MSLTYLSKADEFTYESKERLRYEYFDMLYGNVLGLTSDYVLK